MTKSGCKIDIEMTFYTMGCIALSVVRTSLPVTLANAINMLLPNINQIKIFDRFKSVDLTFSGTKRKKVISNDLI